MRFGKISATLLAIAVVTFIFMIVLRPGCSTPIAMLGALLILGCMPMSLIFGIVGIVQDRSKTLAIVVTVLALAIGVIFFLGQLLNC
jgi:hypothetical protein